MTQADGSSQVRADLQLPETDASMAEGTRDFLSELDSFQQCVNEFNLGRKGFRLNVEVPAVAAGEILDMKSGRHGDHQALREEDLSEISFAGTGGIGVVSSSCNDVCSVLRLESTTDGFVSTRSCEPQSAPESSRTGVSDQSTSKQDEQATISTADAPKRRNQNRSRKRQREEIEHLRVSAQQRGDLQFAGAASKSISALSRGTYHDSAIFAALRQGLDAQYQRLSAVWDECNFKASSVESKSPNQLKCDDKGRFYLEHARSRTFPFTADAVSRAIWQRAKGGVLTPNNGELKIRSISGNTVCATLTDTISLLSAPESTIKVWITLKRFVEEHQIVMVWQARMDIENSQRVQMSESAWNVVRSIREVGKSGCGLNMAPCISQTCIRSTLDPNCATGVSNEELAESRLTARVVAQYHENMSMLNQTIENFLLDESLARGGGGSTLC